MEILSSTSFYYINLIVSFVVLMIFFYCYHLLDISSIGKKYRQNTKFLWEIMGITKKERN